MPDLKNSESKKEVLPKTIQCVCVRRNERRKRNKSKK